MDIVAVILIIGLAGIYMARRLYKGLKSKPSCGCGLYGRDCMEQELLRSTKSEAIHNDQNQSL